MRECEIGAKMSNSVVFQRHLISIMEILTKTAVSEIIKLVDDNCAMLHLEMSRSQIENKTLKRKLKLMEQEMDKQAKQLSNYTERYAELQSSVQVLEGEGKVKETVCSETVDIGVWEDPERVNQVLEMDVLQTAFPPEVEPYWSEERLLSIPMKEKVQQDSCVTGVMAAALNVSGQGADTQEQLPVVQGFSDLVTYGPCGRFSDAVDLEPYDGHSVERSPAAAGTVSTCFPASVPEEKPETDVVALVIIKEEADVHIPSNDEGLLTTPSSRGGSCDTKKEDWELQLCQSSSKARETMVEEPSTPKGHRTSSRVHLARKSVRRTDTGEKLYSCSHCGKRFSHQSNVYKHMRIHTGEKPYSCPTCGKCFTQQSNLRRHQLIHTGEKPFSCSHCGKSFTRLFYLKIHQQVHTRDKQDSFAKHGRSWNN